MNEADIIFGCVKESYHWTVVVVDLVMKTLTYFDSKENIEKATSKTKLFVKNWRLFARDFNKMVGENDRKLIEGVKFMPSAHHALQGFDNTCGIWALMVRDFS